MQTPTFSLNLILMHLVSSSILKSIFAETITILSGQFRISYKTVSPFVVLTGIQCSTRREFGCGGPSFQMPSRVSLHLFVYTFKQQTSIKTPRQSWRPSLNLKDISNHNIFTLKTYIFSQPFHRSWNIQIRNLQDTLTLIRAPSNLSPTPLINHIEKLAAIEIPLVRRGSLGETRDGIQWDWKVLNGWWAWEAQFGFSTSNLTQSIQSSPDFHDTKAHEDQPQKQHFPKTKNGSEISMQRSELSRTVTSFRL